VKENKKIKPDMKYYFTRKRKKKLRRKKDEI